MKKKPNYFDLNTREKRIYQARKKLTDEFFMDFFDSMREYQDTMAMRIAIEELDEGNTLDEIFYTGEMYGFHIITRDEDDNNIVIELGYVAGPRAGDGNSYAITFEQDGHYHIEPGSIWNN